MIKNLLFNVIINGVVLYFIHKYDLGFKVVASEYDVYITFLVLGFGFRFFNALLKRILIIFTLPLKILTLGLSSFVINVFVIYVFEYAINGYVNGIQVLLGTITQVLIISFIFAVLHLLIKKI